MSVLPEPLRAGLASLLESLGDKTQILSARPVGGGCINNGMRLQSGQGVYFLKWNPDPLPGMFPTEAYGLSLIADTRTVRVPAVLGLGEAAPQRPAFILLEWLEGPQPDQAALGAQLAEMHRRGVSPRDPPSYGLDRDNYIGSTPQVNGWDEDWIAFFRERRLRPQAAMAQRGGRLPAERRQGLERLMDHLDRWLGGVERRPALLHGDLWGGNVIAGPQSGALIDPAVYYGDREADLAFTELFGGILEPLLPGLPGRLAAGARLPGSPRPVQPLSPAQPPQPVWRKLRGRGRRGAAPLCLKRYANEPENATWLFLEFRDMKLSAKSAHKNLEP